MRIVKLVVAAALGLSVCRGNVVTWNGVVDTDWFEAGNWTPAQVPVDGDDVVIDASAAPATNVVLSGETAELASLSVSDAVLTFTNWTTTVHATNVMIGAGGVFTLPGAFAAGAMSNRVHVVCSALSILPEGVIDVDGKGFGQNAGTGKGTFADANAGGGGAGHGGSGGRGHWTTGGLAGSTYGILQAPVDPGSGGAGLAAELGGAGGGAVRIEAPGGTVTINGTISANGKGGVLDGGGGSGGSIYITCDTFADSTNGVLRARGGGSAAGGGGGGGGRIAVQYATLSNSKGIRFSTSAGPGIFGANDWWLAASRRRPSMAMAAAGGSPSMF